MLDEQSRIRARFLSGAADGFRCELGRDQHCVQERKNSPIIAMKPMATIRCNSAEDRSSARMRFRAGPMGGMTGMGGGGGGPGAIAGFTLAGTAALALAWEAAAGRRDAPRRPAAENVACTADTTRVCPVPCCPE